MKANCYLVSENNSCFLIDPADNGTFLLEEIERQQLELVALIATHGHFDHVMAAGEIQMSYMSRYQQKVPFYISEDDVFLLKRLIETARHYLSVEPMILPIQEALSLTPGMHSIKPFKLKVIRTPGHTPGSSCIYLEKEKKLFTGDTVFAEGAVGRTDFSYSSKAKLYDSLKTILSLPEDVEVYAGHGEVTSIGELQSIIDLS
jgi:glyoxylase-like metal-dependent hydrolase (beta-lactamase superfamily II)